MPVGPPPTTTTLRAPSSISDGWRSAASQHCRTWSRSRTASAQRVHGKAVLVGAGDPEEVHARAERDDQVVVGEGVHVLEPHFAAVEVDAVHRGLVHDGVGLVVEQVAQRMAAGRRLQQVGGDLVQQRLERVVVVPVDEHDVHVGVLELAGRTHAPEAAAEDEDPGTVGSRSVVVGCRLAPGCQLRTPHVVACSADGTVHRCGRHRLMWVNLRQRPGQEAAMNADRPCRGVPGLGPGRGHLPPGVGHAGRGAAAPRRGPPGPPRRARRLPGRKRDRPPPAGPVGQPAGGPPLRGRRGGGRHDWSRPPDRRARPGDPRDDDRSAGLGGHGPGRAVPGGAVRLRGAARPARRVPVPPRAADRRRGRPGRPDHDDDGGGHG